MSEISTVSWSNASIIESLQKLAERTDAAYVLITSSALEEFLEKALLAKMRTMTTKRRGRLFKGLLSTFAAKIDVAYAFEIIGDDVVNDFQVIRKIRNAFAHTTVLLHFNSQEIAGLFRALTGFAKEKDLKKLFEQRVAACVAALQSRIDASTLVAALEGRSTLPSKSQAQRSD